MRLREENKSYAENQPEDLMQVQQQSTTDHNSRQSPITDGAWANTHCLMQSGIDTYSMGTSSARSAKL